MMTLEQIKICQRLGLNCDWALQNYSLKEASIGFDNQSRKNFSLHRDKDEETKVEKDLRRFYEDFKPKGGKMISKRVERFKNGDILLNGYAMFYKTPDFYFYDSEGMRLPILIDKNADLEKVAELYRIPNIDKAKEDKGRNDNIFFREIRKIVSPAIYKETYADPMYTVYTETEIQEWMQIRRDLPNGMEDVAIVCARYNPFNRSYKVTEETKFIYNIKKYLDKNGIMVKKSR